MGRNEGIIPRGSPRAPGRSLTWADMSISRGRDNLLPSSVFKKSSKQPEKTAVTIKPLQGHPSLAALASSLLVVGSG